MRVDRVEIIGGGGARVQHTEYRYDPARVDAWPDWLEEVEGYTEKCNQSQTEVTRHYRCPWSKRDEARVYLLGYSVSEAAPNLAADALAKAQAFFATVPAIFLPAGGLPDPPPQAYRIDRVPPVQDPERPWLFCDDAQIERGEGALVQSPYSTYRDGSGRLVIDPDAQALPSLVPCGHYVDNADPQRRHAVEDGVVVREISDAPRFSDGRALIRATFRQKPYTILSDQDLDVAGGRAAAARNELRRWVERTEEPGLEALPLARLAQDGNQLKFAEGPFGPHPTPIALVDTTVAQVIPEAGVVQYPLATLCYTWHDVPDLPRSAFYACLGAVNSQPFDGFRGTPVYPAETLLCLPMRYQQQTGPTGRIAWKIQYRFSYRPQKWNRFPAGDGRHYKATWGGGAGGDTVYRLADFAQLFTVPPPVLYLN